jgi:hypothetical protein
MLDDRTETAICYTAPIQILDDDSLRRPQDHHGDWPTDPVQSLIAREIGVNRVLASSAVFKRDAIKFNPGYRYSGDWLAMLEAAVEGPFAFVEEPLTCWRIHPENAHKQHFGTLLEEVAVRQSIIDAGRYWFKPHEPEGPIVDALIENAIRLHSLYIIFGDKSNASLALHGAEAAGIMNPTIKKRMSMGFLPLFLMRDRIWPNTNPKPYEEAYKSGTPPIHKFRDI